MLVRFASWLQAHSRPQSDGRSTTDAVAGDPRTNATSTSPMFYDADRHLGSDSQVACSSKGTRARMARALPFSATGIAYPLNDRTGLFPGQEAGADALAT